MRVIQAMQVTLELEEPVVRVGQITPVALIQVEEAKEGMLMQG